MKTPAERLKALRIASGHQTPTAFADAHKLKPVTYLSHERGPDAGGRGIRRPVAEKYAQLFTSLGIEVSADWIRYGAGDPPDILTGRRLDMPPDLAGVFREVDSLDIDCVRDAATAILTIMADEDLHDTPENTAAAIVDTAIDITRERHALKARGISIGGKVIPMDRLKRA